MCISKTDAAILRAAQMLIFDQWGKGPTNPDREQFFTELTFAIIDVKNKYKLDYEFNIKEDNKK